MSFWFNFFSLKNLRVFDEISIHLKRDMTDLQWYPWNLYLIHNVENIVVFLDLKVFISDNSYMFSCGRNARNFFCRETAQLKIISFWNYKHGYLIHTWSDKDFKGSVVNRALPSLHGGSLEIMLTILSLQILIHLLLT